MQKTCIILYFIISISSAFAESNYDNFFYVGRMESHNNLFTLHFKTREKSILARGENDNYINDYPKDLYIYNYSTKSSSPLIS